MTPPPAPAPYPNLPLTNSKPFASPATNRTCETSAAWKGQTCAGETPTGVDAAHHPAATTRPKQTPFSRTSTLRLHLLFRPPRVTLNPFQGPKYATGEHQFINTSGSECAAPGYRLSRSEACQPVLPCATRIPPVRANSIFRRCADSVQPVSHLRGCAR